MSRLRVTRIRSTCVALLLVGGAAHFAAPTTARATPSPTAAPAAPAEQAQATPPPRPAPIDRNGILILLRTTLVALQQANQTGNYSVLLGISAPGFQSANTPDRLSQVFANLRAKNFDLSGVVVLEPQLNVLPELYSNGVMRFAGFFPSAPMQVYFDLQFIAVQGQWKLLAIGVNVGSATPAAPIVNVSPAQATAVETPGGGEAKQTPKPKASATATPRP